MSSLCTVPTDLLKYGQPNNYRPTKNRNECDSIYPKQHPT